MSDDYAFNGILSLECDFTGKCWGGGVAKRVLFLVQSANDFMDFESKMILAKYNNMGVVVYLFKK